MHWLLTCVMVWTTAGADRTWTGDSWNSNWSEADNWSPSGPPQDGDTLIFGNLASQKSNNNNLSNLRVQSIVFNGSSGGYSLSGNPILLNADITAAHASGNNNVRFDVQFINGGGTFNVVNGGRMEIAGTVTLASNALLIAFTLGTNLTISGAIVGDGELLKLGVHSLFLAGTAANTYTGPTTINGGVVYLAKTSGARAISTRVSIGVNTLLNSRLADIQGGQYPPAMSMVVGPRGTWAMTNGATVSSLFLDNNSVIAGEGLLNVLCNITNRGYARIDCSLYLGSETRTFFTEYVPSNISQLVVNGHILGPSGGANPPGLIKDGPGYLRLGNQNTYSGPTLIEDGELWVEHGQALGTSGRETRLRPFGDLVFNGDGPLALAEPFVMEGGNVYFQCDATLSGSITLNHGCGFSGSSDKRLELSGPILGEQGFAVWGGTVRLSGTAPNTFAGDVMVWPSGASSVAVLELAKPNDVPAVPTALTVRGFDTRTAVLRNFQDNGARDISIYDRGVWDLNGYAATPSSLKFYGAGIVDTGTRGTIQGILNFTGTGVNTQLQLLPKTFAPSNYTVLIQGRVDLFSPTNDLFIPPGVTLNLRAEIRGLVVQKRGPGKLILARDNRFLGRILAHDGELVSAHDHALGGHTTVFDGATLWLDTVFNFGSLTIQGRGFQGTHGALAASGLALFSSNIVLSAPATINTESTNGNLHIQGAISGTGPLTKEGLGILALEGAAPNTFGGDMFVNAGLCVLAKNSFIPAVPENIVIGSGLPGAPGATVVYGAHDQIWNRITVNRGSLLDLNGWDEYSGHVTLNEGGDIDAGAGTLYLSEGVHVFVNPGADTGGSIISGRLGLGPGPHRFEVDAGSGLPGLDLGINDNIIQMSAAADIVKNGTGFLSLIGSNSFSGTLTVNDGALYAGHPFAFGTSAGATILNGNASLSFGGNLWVREEPLTLNSTNSLALSSLAGSNTWSGNITLQKTASIRVWAGTLNIMGFFDCCPGIITGPGGITKSGPGTLLVSGFAPNDYAGPTIVNEGVLEAWRILSPALPGHVFVIGSNATLRTGRFPANTALAPGARVTLNHGALWKMNPTNNETIGALSGNGVLDLGNLGTGVSLTVDNPSFCEFSGTIVGTGLLNKRGPATFLLSGQSPIYGGAVTIFEGALKVDGRMPGTPVTVKAGAQLRGDGAVGDVTAIEQDSLLQVDASVAEHPGRHGGDLEVTYLTLADGAGVGADIYGPSPTGGNDTLIARGPVSLGDARLSTAFSYPPRDGDVVTLLRKNSVGPINGIFAGWPEGITRKLGHVTVRASYLGGDGNDFTLTVTNLPLSFFGYRLAEGNGNQTVEPDECNLVFVSLLNRRSSQLIVTNALLRANTPGAAVTVASATYPPIPAGAARENLTPFQFRSDKSLLCGQPVQLELIFGVQGEGEFAAAFEIIAGEGESCTHPTGGCESCLAVRGQFSPNSPTLTRAHTFVGGPSVCFPPKSCPQTNIVTSTAAVPYLTHVFTNSTTNEICVTAQLRFDCPAAPSNALGAVAYLGTNDYHSPCVNYLGDSGADGSAPFSFRVPAGSNFVLLVSARATNVICDRYTLEIFGLPCPPPLLYITKDAVPNNVLLQWSTAYPDHQLQAAHGVNGLPAPPFENVSTAPVITAGRYLVTNSTSGAQCIYRLAK